MRLLIKQRVFSWTDSYDIYDEQGNVKYFVKAEPFTWGHSLHVFNQNQQEIGAIKQEIFTLLPRFVIEQNGQEVGTIQKKFSLFMPQYEMDCRGWRVDGDFLGWDYDVYEGCSAIIHITKELFHWGDTYVIDFSNPQDEVMGLLLVIAIDAANCSK